MVQTSDDGVVQDRNAGANGLCRVVEQRGQVRVGCETETGHTLVGAVDDEEGAVRNGSAGGLSAKPEHKPTSLQEHTRLNTSRRIYVRDLYT